MMKIILYINTAENNRVDKESYLEKVIEVEGALRDSSSVLTPCIVFELPNLSASELIDEDGNLVETSDDEVIAESDFFYQFNYAYIAEFGRYYFVSDIQITRSHIFMVSMVVDVLMSFKDNLLALDAFIDRNEFDYNSTIPDDLIPLTLEKQVMEYVPDRGSFVNTTFDTNLENDSYTITITILGVMGSYEEIEPPTDSGLPKINDYNMTSSTTTYIIRESDYLSIINGLMGDYSTYKDYVLSIVAYPFEVDSQYPDIMDVVAFGYDENHDPRTIPYFDESGDPVQGKFGQSFSKYMVVADFEIPYVSNFTYFEPFAQYELYIPYFGWVKLDFDLVKGHRLLVYYACNRDDGSATAYVWDYTGKRMVYSTPCQLGIKLAYSSTNQEELTAQKNAIGLNLAVGLISSALTIGMGAVAKNPVAVAKGTIAGASAITSAINAYSMLFPRASATFGDSTTGLYSPTDVRLRVTKNVILPSDMGKFRKLYGAPLKQNRLLSVLSGFTIVGDVHLEGINAYKKEKDEIDRLLKSGVIL